MAKVVIEWKAPKKPEPGKKIDVSHIKPQKKIVDK
jgi:hypothetical protein